MFTRVGGLRDVVRFFVSGIEWSDGRPGDVGCLNGWVWTFTQRVL